MAEIHPQYRSAFAPSTVLINQQYSATSMNSMAPKRL